MAFLLQRLYTLGARKVIIAGLGLMGCIPSILSQSSTSQCSEEVNQLVLPFNANTKTMINNLNTNLPGARITFIDIHNMIQDILANPGSYGNFSSTYLLYNRSSIVTIPLQNECLDGYFLNFL